VIARIFPLVAFLLLACLCFRCGSAFALDLEHLHLKKIDGKPLKVTELKSKKLIIFVAAGTGCPVVRQYLSKLNSMAERWKSKQIQFYLIGVARHDTFASFRTECRGAGLHFPAAFDEGQALASRLHFQTTAQVAVYDVKEDAIIYSGAIDDRVGPDGGKPEATHDYLASVLTAAAAGKRPPISSTQAFGCAITY
jgi:hypothetical protein